MRRAAPHAHWSWSMGRLRPNAPARGDARSEKLQSTAPLGPPPRRLEPRRTAAMRSRREVDPAAINDPPRSIAGVWAGSIRGDADPGVKVLGRRALTVLITNKLRRYPSRRSSPTAQGTPQPIRATCSESTCSSIFDRPMKFSHPNSITTELHRYRKCYLEKTYKCASVSLRTWLADDGRLAHARL